MAGIKLITETKEQDVALLKNVDAEFVSLVRHGANRMPFRVIKKEKGGEDTTMKGLAIQSVLLPKGTTLEQLTTLETLAFLADARSDKVEKFEGYDKLVQTAAEKFDPATFRLAKAGDNAWVLVGNLLDGVDSKNVLTLGDKDVEKLAAIPMAPMDAIIGDTAAAQTAAIAVSFSELFHRELNSMMDIVYGSLKQSSADPKKRKGAIMGAVDAFKNFLGIGLDAIGSSATKIEKPSVLKEEEVLDMFKTKEEFVEATTDVITAVLKKRDEDAEAKVKEEADAKIAADAQAAAQKVLDLANKGDKDKGAGATDKDGEMPEWAKTLSEKVDGVVVAQKELGDQLETDPDANKGDGGDSDVNKGDGDNKGTGTDGDDEKKKSPFAGLLVKKAA